MPHQVRFLELILSEQYFDTVKVYDLRDGRVLVINGRDVTMVSSCRIQISLIAVSPPRLGFDSR